MNTFSRRSFLASAATVAALPPSILLTGGPALAADMPKVNPDDSQAKALSYVHTSPSADNLCSNCQLYSGDTASVWGPCAIFPGKLVAGDGWCSAWTKKVG